MRLKIVLLGSVLKSIDSKQVLVTSGVVGKRIEPGLAAKLDGYSFEAVVELKISRFLDQIGTYYPEDLHALIMAKAEKPLFQQILKRTGGNQVHQGQVINYDIGYVIGEYQSQLQGARERGLGLMLTRRTRGERRA